MDRSKYELWRFSNVGSLESLLSLEELHEKQNIFMTKQSSTAWLYYNIHTSGVLGLKSFRAGERIQLHQGLTTELSDNKGQRGESGTNQNTAHSPCSYSCLFSNLEVKIELYFGKKEIWNLPPAAASGVKANRQDQQDQGPSEVPAQNTSLSQHFFWLLQAVHTPHCESHIVKLLQQSGASAWKLQNLDSQYRSKSCHWSVPRSPNICTVTSLSETQETCHTVEIRTWISIQGISL